jgi:hypothetical protein
VIMSASVVGGVTGPVAGEAGVDAGVDAGGADGCGGFPQAATTSNPVHAARVRILTGTS